MSILENPTKYKSRQQLRKEKLAAIGVNINDIEAQRIEDSALPNKKRPAMSKPKPMIKAQDVQSKFETYGFKVSFYITNSSIKFDQKLLTEEKLDTKKYQNLVESQKQQMNKLTRKLAKGMLTHFFSSVFSIICKIQLIICKIQLRFSSKLSR